MQIWLIKICNCSIHFFPPRRFFFKFILIHTHTQVFLQDITFTNFCLIFLSYISYYSRISSHLAFVAMLQCSLELWLFFSSIFPRPFYFIYSFSLMLLLTTSENAIPNLHLSFDFWWFRLAFLSIGTFVSLQQLKFNISNPCCLYFLPSDFQIFLFSPVTQAYNLGLTVHLFHHLDTHITKFYQLFPHRKEYVLGNISEAQFWTC